MFSPVRLYALCTPRTRCERTSTNADGAGNLQSSLARATTRSCKSLLLYTAGACMRFKKLAIASSWQMVTQIATRACKIGAHQFRALIPDYLTGVNAGQQM